MLLWVIYCTFGYCFLGHSKAPVLSSLMKLHCAGAHYDLFFSYVKKKNQNMSTFLYLHGITWLGLECWLSLKCFPLFLNKGLVRSSGVACSPFGGGSFDNIIYVNVCGRVTEDGQNIYNSWVKSLIKICYDVTSLGPLSICSVSSP